ncbi:MAG: hypothetical protein N3B21_18140 [Clostridia bacterium]|nr:hypothetical protein [Clostridia bacterium]
MDGNTVAVFGVAIISTVGLIITLSSQIMHYKLKKEQIKADAMLKAEEINAKNKLEIEQLYLVRQSSENPSGLHTGGTRFSEDNRSVREKIR